MFEGDSADIYGVNFSLVSMGGRADPSSVRRRGARTPIGATKRIMNYFSDFDNVPAGHEKTGNF